MYCFFPLVSFAKSVQGPKVCIITLGSNNCLSTSDACDLFGKAVCPADVSGQDGYNVFACAVYIYDGRICMFVRYKWRNGTDANT